MLQTNFPIQSLRLTLESNDGLFSYGGKFEVMRKSVS